MRADCFNFLKDPRMWKVHSCCSLPDFVATLFRETFEFVQCTSLAEAVGQGADPDVLLVSVETRLDAEAINSLPHSVRAVATYSVGTDHVDKDALAAKGIPFLNTPDVLSASVAETAVFLALGAARRATESIGLIRSGKWSGWTPRQLIGTELASKTAGIIGMGRIGREIATRLRGLGMSIEYNNRRPLDPGVEAGARYRAELDTLLEHADLVVLACPANDSTRHMINARRIDRMKPGALLVNVSRGNVVVDDALIEALETGRIAGAGLDVFDGEPDFDRRYLNLPNAFILPHIGSSTKEARMRMGMILRDGLIELSKGRQPSNLVLPS